MTSGMLLVLYITLFFLYQLVFRGLDFINLRYLKRHSEKIPPRIARYFTADEYRRALSYSRERQRFGLAAALAEGGLLLLLLLLRFPYHATLWLQPSPFPAVVKAAATVIVVGIPFYLLGLIVSAYSQFVIEERHGFNRMQAGLFLADQAKGLLLGLLLGVPVLLFLLWSVDALGLYWWLWAYAGVTLFQLTLAFVFPVWIMPLFYRFTPLKEGGLKERLANIAESVGFTLTSVQVMDGSRRSSHSNAFFTGFGRNKRIALFDTLMESLDEEQTVAVVAHELGHAKLKHTRNQLLTGLASLFAGFLVLGLLLNWPPLLGAFGFPAGSVAGLLIILLYFSEPFSAWLTPLQSAVSRRREYAADSFAKQVCGGGKALSQGLLTLQKENRSNPVPHPWYSFMHYTHPTVWERIERLEQD